MCGILGYFSTSKPISESRFQSALEKLNHRGPDNQNLKAFQSGYLGHSRLSIIDLIDNSNQPFQVNDRYWIIFNGEIYNYKIIREYYQNTFGVEYRSNSDTEVLLKSYTIHKENVLERLNGMFAFAIYDSQKNNLFLARDRVGKKPLYYSITKNTLVFGSELKATLQLLDRTPALSDESVHEFLSIGYITAPDTIYTQFKKLEPGHYLQVDLDTMEISKKCYWEIAQNLNGKAEDGIDELIKDSIKLRYVADVPVGLMLSGGLDSNLILGLSNHMSPETFTIRSNHSEYDESHFAIESAKHFNCKNTTKDVTQKAFIIDELVYYFDEPMGDSSAVPTFLLSKLISEANYRCVLNGDGADEVFAGYDRYKMLLLYAQYNRLAKLIPPLPIQSFLYKGFGYNYNRLRNLLKEPTIERAYAKQNIINHNFQGPRLKGLDYSETILNKLGKIQVDGLNKFLVYDYKYYLPDDLLVKMDRATMANSLEVRSPFLDYRLAEQMINIPFEKKISIKNNKILLRNYYHNLLPTSILKRKKTGFQIPIDHWFGGSLRDEVAHLSNSELVKEGFVDRFYINRIVNSHLSKKENNKFQIYLLLFLDKWYKRWIIN